MASQALDPELQLAEEVAKFYADPYGFVLAMYPWGEPGPLEPHDGPDKWQAELLRQIGQEVREHAFDGVHAVRPIRHAVSSGHGVGKSTLVAWLVDWIMSTRPHARGTLTANTFQQLQDKTWATLKRWTKLCLTGHWFELTDRSMYHHEHRDSWFCAPATAKDENSEAFAGQHAADSTSFYVFDEDSAISDSIHDVAEGGLTDGEPMIFLFGNPTRNSGHFHRACFGSQRELWNPLVIDSRECKFTNKDQIAEWIKNRGENSDFVRVRVRGLPPASSDLQFIDADTVYEAQKREPVLLGDEPLVAGLDLARGGADECCLRFRRGADARSIQPLRIPGEESRDSMRVISAVTDALDHHHVGALFVDATGGSVGGPVADRLKQLGYNVIPVQFAGKAPDSSCANMRAFMWSKMRDWLRTVGAIDKTPHLEADLVGPGYEADRQDRLLLESKEDMKARGLDSPDDGDALALTFAAPIGPAKRVRAPGGPAQQWGWT